MTFHVTHLTGDMESDVPLESLPGLLDEVNEADGEHTDVSLTHETEWCLSTSAKGLLVWENLESRESKPRHMNGVERAHVLRLWTALADGDLAMIDAEPWLPGYS
jgi:hypothetical protein